MKRIQMKTLACGPGGTRQVNDIVVVGDAEADELVRYNEAVMLGPVETSDPDPEPEAADVVQPIETATVEAPEVAARVGRPEKKATKKRAAKRKS